MITRITLLNNNLIYSFLVTKYRLYFVIVEWDVVYKETKLGLNMYNTR